MSKCSFARADSIRIVIRAISLAQSPTLLTAVIETPMEPVHSNRAAGLHEIVDRKLRPVCKVLISTHLSRPSSESLQQVCSLYHSEMNVNFLESQLVSAFSTEWIIAFRKGELFLRIWCIVYVVVVSVSHF